METHTPRLARAAGTILTVLVMTACGGGDAGSTGTSTTAASPTTASPTSSIPVPVLSVAVAPAGWKLPAPLAREVAVYDGRQIVLLGGFDQAKTSTGAIVKIDPTTGSSSSGGSLSVSVHDAAVAHVGEATLVIGGGGPAENSVTDVQSVPATGATTVISHLAGPRADHVAATVGGRTYVLGGYDGAKIVGDVVSSPTGVTWTAAGTLPNPVRYPAVAAVGTSIYLFGGVSNLQGVDTPAVQRLDTRTGKIDVVAQLPAPLSHAAAVVIGGLVFLIGGYVNSSQLSDQVLRFDPNTNASAVVGRLPAPLSDAAAVVVADRGYVLGGQGTDRAPVATVTTISLP